MNNKDPYEKEKQQLDEALNLVGDKLRKQSLEYSEFKNNYHKHNECSCRAGYDCDVCNRLLQQIRNSKEIIDDDTKQKSDLKNKINSLIAAINTAITEWPSNQASIYLDGIMKNFSK